MRSILGDVFVARPPLLRPSPLHRQILHWHPPRSRGVATATNQTPEFEDLALPSRPDGHPPPFVKLKKEDSKGPMKIAKAPSRLILNKELEWIHDPLKLADRVMYLIKTKGDTGHEKALALVERASKGMPCTVSWNHLIDFEMGGGRVKQAVKLYNDMKKRAQTPDARTFTTLFRGCSRNVRTSPSVLEKALAIYHSMFADNSPVKPTLIHTNAVLDVCARSGNIDAVFGVAARLPVTGAAAPDKRTFTIILNAIKIFATEDSKGEHGSAALRERQDRAVLQGRRIWDEVKERWSKGDLEIDDELVCAMGRLLMIGNTEHDYDDVLSLIEQTMNIPRQLAPLRDPDRTRPTPEPCDEDGDSNSSALSLTDHTLANAPTNADEDIESTDIFTNPLAKFLPEQCLVHPSPNALSLAVESCTNLRQGRAAQDYWGLLTSSDKYNIIPDQENYHVYLRLLRYQRASRLALGIVEEMHKGALEPPRDSQHKISLQRKTFRIALSTCARDMRNRNALGYAERIVVIMTETLEVPDPACLVSFLDTALGQQPRDWRTLMQVARRTAVHVRTLNSLSALGFAWTKPKNWLDMQRKENEVLALVKQLVRVFDVVLTEGREGLEQKDKVVCRDTRDSLTAFVTRRMHKRKGIPGKMVRNAENEKRQKFEKSKDRVSRLLDEGRREGNDSEYRDFRGRQKRPNSLV